MSEIPEDIFAIARSLADAAVSTGNYTQAALDIAKAIHAERKRRQEFKCACGGVPYNPYPGWLDEQ